MTALNRQALRGQSVEGSFYLAECGHCGEMYPSNKLDGGEPLFSGDYGECFCHLCGADDSDIADNGAWGSEAVTAWNYQQKRIEALLDELEAEKNMREAAEKRIAELEAPTTNMNIPDGWAMVPINPSMAQEYAGYKTLTDTGKMSRLMKTRIANIYRAMITAAAGIGVKGE